MSEDGQLEIRNAESDLGGSMRLGGQQCRLQSDSLAFQLYQKDVITERHRHRYEFNSQYLEKLEKAGMKFSGKSIDGRLVEVVEISGHPWFLACQFHPEFTSTPRKGHPLFSGFVKAAVEHKKGAVK
jgi:CTP synthase